MSERINPYTKKPAGISPSGRPYEAVIIEDSATSRIMLKQILLSVKFNVIAEYVNGEEALNALRLGVFNPEYFFVDLEMPLMDGMSLVKEIKPMFPKSRIFMVTSHSNKEQVEQIVKLGIEGYIRKPYDRDKLIARLAGD